MDTNSVTSKPSPIADSSSDFGNNADEKIYIPTSEAASYSSETKSLVDRSTIRTRKISGYELRRLILEQNFSNGVHYQVKGDLSLVNCSGLKALPENLTVGDDLYLEDCTSLTAPPKNSSEGSSLDLRGCTSLKALPDSLAVKRNLILNGCTGLTALPENLYVGRTLLLENCTGLTALPEKFSVEGSLDLEGCTGLAGLPDSLSVGHNLFLNGCSGLTALPENLSVGNNLYIKGCTSLTTLPENLYVVRTLNLKGCTSLMALPGNLSVGDDLYLEGCTSLTALPENLYVGRTLNLRGCTSLTALPENLSVGGDLYLKGCTSLTALPENLLLGADLDLMDCTSLTALPNWITTLGATHRGTRNVYLENTGLSDALIDRLQTAIAPGIQFHFSRNAGQPEQQFLNPEQGCAFWWKLAPSDAAIPKLDLQHDQAVDLARFLGRLTTTADYQNQATRPVLAQRVVEVMSLLSGDDQVRDDALRRIHYALSSCDDRVILALDDLETLQLLITAETLAFKSRDPSQLLAIGLQMMRLDKVRKIARDHMKTLNWVDEVEVELAFRIGVRKQLELPGSTQDMLFRNCAYVSDQDINDAVKQVNNHCSEDNLSDFLAKWAPWQKFARLKTVPSFDQLKSTVVAHIDNCAISCQKADNMVALGNVHLDYETLVKAYLENGNDPFTNKPLEWSNVVRLTEEEAAPPPCKKSRLSDA